MPIAISCAQCDWKGNVKNELAGRKGKCPTCGEPITVPKSPADPDDVEAAAAAALMEGDNEPLPAPPQSYSPPPAAAYSAQRSEPKTAERPAPKPVGMKFEFRPKEVESPRRGISINGTAVGGLLVMGGAAVWFFVALAAGWVFFYPPFLFVAGLIQFFRGLFGHED